MQMLLKPQRMYYWFDKIFTFLKDYFQETNYNQFISYILYTELKCRLVIIFFGTNNCINCFQSLIHLAAHSHKPTCIYQYIMYIYCYLLKVMNAITNLNIIIPCDLHEGISFIIGYNCTAVYLMGLRLWLCALSVLVTNFLGDHRRNGKNSFVGDEQYGKFTRCAVPGSRR